MADQFKELEARIRAKQFQEAAKIVESLPTGEALATVDHFDASQLFLWLLELDVHGYGKSRAAYVIYVARFVSVPQTQFQGITGADHDASRKFILKKLDQLAAKGRKAEAKALRMQLERQSFYSDYRLSDRRQRILKVAKEHLLLAPGSDKQTVFYSLGGRFGWQVAESTTHPPGTTCGLFARAVLNASGYRSPQSVKAATGLTLYEYLGAVTDSKGSLHPAWVGYKSGSSAAPKPGDFYIIDGGETVMAHGYDTPREASSAHTGLIADIQVLGNGDWQCRTYDGGQNLGGSDTRPENWAKGWWSRENTRLFTGPEKQLAGDSLKRRLVGWFDVDKITQWQF